MSRDQPNQVYDDTIMLQFAFSAQQQQQQQQQCAGGALDHLSLWHHNCCRLDWISAAILRLKIGRHSIGDLTKPSNAHVACSYRGQDWDDEASARCQNLTSVMQNAQRWH